MRILLMSVGDNGGGCYWMADVINKYTPHKARAVRFTQSWINYPFDIFTPNGGDLSSFMNWADVIHIRDNVSDMWPSIPQNKPVVVTWTGMSYRRRAVQKLEQCKERGWFSTVSTPDLVSYATGDLCPEWLPNPREEMEAEKVEGLIACHAPTFRERKGTDEVIEACSQAGVKLELVEGLTYLESLKVKARCNLVIDQVGPHSYGYGNNAIEAWAMGYPAISGASAPKYTQHTIDTFGQLPYLQTSGTVKNLITQLEAMKNAQTRKRYTDLGQEYFFKFHHAPVVARKAIEIYERCLGG